MIPKFFASHSAIPRIALRNFVAELSLPLLPIFVSGETDSRRRQNQDRRRVSSLQSLYLGARDHRDLFAVAIKKRFARAIPISHRRQLALTRRQRESFIASMHVVDDFHGLMELIYVTVANRIAGGDSKPKKQCPNFHATNGVPKSCRGK